MLVGPPLGGHSRHRRGKWGSSTRAFGRLPWATLVEPAIALADGFEVHQRFLNPYNERLIELLRRFPASAAQFLTEDGQPPALGDVFRQPELAETLRRIAAEGADEFYRGKTADLIVAEMERGGGPHHPRGPRVLHRPLAGAHRLFPTGGTR